MWDFLWLFILRYHPDYYNSSQISLFHSFLVINNYLLICSWHRNLQNIRIRILQIFVLIFFNDLRQKIWGALEKNIRLGFIKGFVIPEQFALLLIKQKNHNKRFGEFEFEYFGDSDVMNRLLESKQNRHWAANFKTEWSIFPAFGGWVAGCSFQVFSGTQQFKLLLYHCAFQDGRWLIEPVFVTLLSMWTDEFVPRSSLRSVFGFASAFSR